MNNRMKTLLLFPLLLMAITAHAQSDKFAKFRETYLKEVKDETKSAMPPFGTDRLSESQLDDIVRYLQTLKGFDPTVK